MYVHNILVINGCYTASTESETTCGKSLFKYGCGKCLYKVFRENPLFPVNIGVRLTSVFFIFFQRWVDTVACKRRFGNSKTCLNKKLYFYLFVSKNIKAACIVTTRRIGNFSR